MNDDRRQAVLDNARYLRGVRPVDPEEIREYVEGRPHPAVVREVLREHAFELGLRERQDGTFVPVEEDSIDPDFDGVRAFPDAYARRLEDLLVEEYGPGWPDGESGDRLRATVRRLKEDYFRRNPVEYDRETALAYAVYHLPDAYAAAQYVLDEVPDLPRRARILDVGAGVGGPMLGVHDYYPGESLVAYEAVEPSAAADVFEAMAEEIRPGFGTTLHRETAEAHEPAGEYDLVLFANVLNELDDPEAVVRRYGEFLATEGSLVALEPADRNTAIALREVERSVEDALTVYAPTVRLWPGESPRDRGWSFQRQPDLDAPGFQRRLDEGASKAPDGDGVVEREHAGDGEFVNVDVQYAWVVLRRDGRRAVEVTPDEEHVAKMADMETHVTERIDLLALKLSPDLSDDGNPLFKVSDGSEAVDHYAVLTNGTSLNADLQRAGYGDLLHFENVLVLWNDDEGAYNLVVDEETIVDRVAA